MQQWTNWERVFSTRSAQHLHDATKEWLLGEKFSVRFVPRCYKQDKSGVRLVVRQSPVSEDVNTKVEGSTALKPLPDNDWGTYIRQKT
jgi:hypothetical protein